MLELRERHYTSKELRLKKSRAAPDRRPLDEFYLRACNPCYHIKHQPIRAQFEKKEMEVFVSEYGFSKRRELRVKQSMSAHLKPRLGAIRQYEHTTSQINPKRQRLIRDDAA